MISALVLGQAVFGFPQHDVRVHVYLLRHPVVRACVEILLPCPGVLERHKLIEIGSAVDHGFLIHRDAIAGHLVCYPVRRLARHAGRRLLDDVRCSRYRLRRRLVNVGLQQFRRCFSYPRIPRVERFVAVSLAGFLYDKTTHDAHVVLVVIPGQYGTHLLSSL